MEATVPRGWSDAPRPGSDRESPILQTAGGMGMTIRVQWCNLLRAFCIEVYERSLSMAWKATPKSQLKQSAVARNASWTGLSVSRLRELDGTI
jgi:hypothetical protein